MWPEEPLHNLRLRPQLLSQLRLFSKAPRSEDVQVLPPEVVFDPRWLIFLVPHSFELRQHELLDHLRLLHSLFLESINHQLLSSTTTTTTTFAA